MTLTHRVIVCLDVTGNRVVKGVKFESLRDVGDPAELATRYELEGADEIVFLDVSATRDARALLLDRVRRTAERLFIPLTVGGGVRTVTDASTALRAGADKVAVNSAASERPALIDEMAAQSERSASLRASTRNNAAPTRGRFSREEDRWPPDAMPSSGRASARTAAREKFC